ncbi:hypothetical protein V1264_018398 [Littorina saxatilis]|uniref:Crossover junction endonuclease MUS81 n=1 Tax=Littorina saxatilis TaxID=31220 RepID=A0AAN9GCS2_9CAEN
MSLHKSADSLFGKRKRKKETNPNPLFAEWIAEWRDEAKEKGWKSEFIYSKALKSLKRFPLPLSTGKECKILQNFGDKVCKMLDDRLLKHKQEQENQAFPDFPTSGLFPATSSSSATTMVFRGKPVGTVHEISDSSGDEADSRCGTTLYRGAGLGPVTGRSNAKPEKCVVKVGINGTEGHGRSAFNNISATKNVKTANSVSGALSKTAFTNILSTDRLQGGEEEEVSITGRTSPFDVDTFNLSDDDDNLPTLPRLPDLSVGDIPRLPELQAVGNSSKSRRHSQSKKLKLEDKRDVGQAVSAATVRETHSVSDSDGDEAGQAPPPQRARGGGGDRQPREYVPAYRSGPYAILLTLFRLAQDPNFRGFMTKAELARQAQPLADKSFTAPDPGSRYTAWSSVSVLIKKGFLTKESSPAKFRLTDQGFELAHRLEEAERRNVATDGGGAGRHEGGDRHRAAPGGDLGERGGNRSISAGSGTVLDEDSYSLADTDKKRSSHLPLPSITSADRELQAAASVDVTPTRTEPLVQDAHVVLEEDWEMMDEDWGAALPELALPSLAQRLKASTASVRPAAVAVSVTNDNRELQYWYVADNDTLVTRKDQACVSVEEEFGVGFLVKINYQHLLQSGSQYKLDMSRPLGDDFVFVYLADVHCYEEAKPPSSSAASSKPFHGISDSESDAESLPSIPSVNITASSSTDILPPVKTTAEQKQTSVKNSAKRGSIASGICSSGAVYNALQETGRSTMGLKVSSTATFPSISSATSLKSSTDSGRLAAMPRVPSVSDSQSSVDSVKSVVSEGVDDFVLQPGTFDVVLCVDNREFYGSKSSSKSLLPDLIKNGVNCDLRLLNVGDLLWVAREKAAPGAPLGLMGNAQPARRELVLNYVVERKRMDDLVSSMIGGRLREQKFRLKHSGLQEKIILIESYGSMQNFSLSEDRIKQGIANSEIIDGFTVKHTRDSKETAAYLTLMTRYLQSYYQNKILRSCSQDRLKELGIKFGISDTEHRLMPFDHFNQSSLKNKPLTVLELFAKQLIQLHGMSADKARAIVDRYPTPSRSVALNSMMLSP